MGLSTWFSDFCSNLQIQDGGTISSRYKTITRRLNTDFWNTTSDTAHSLYVGSYGRNTAIKGFSDLDMVFELPSALYFQYDKYTGNGQSALLQAVRNSMQKTYSTSSIGGDGQVIVVSFQDGITFEVVPVFTNQSDSYIKKGTEGINIGQSTDWPITSIETRKQGSCDAEESKELYSG